MNDISGLQDIKVMVNDFYGKIQKDELLAPVFASRIESGNWEAHLNKMYGFWNTVLFFEKGYKGNPFSKHIGLSVSEKHFLRWIRLFHETIDTHFEGEKAEETKMRASKMAALFSSKIEYYDKHPDSMPIM